MFKKLPYLSTKVEGTKVGGTNPPDKFRMWHLTVLCSKRPSEEFRMWWWWVLLALLWW